ncbi:bifunctional AP-4-A phosphorylase/ADP sulfurylase, partial [Serendipita sp. 400]
AILDALASGDLKYYESTSEEVLDSGISYQVRLCPALAQKHQVRAPTPNIAPDSHDVLKVVETITKTDPFLPPFNTLLVGEMEDADTGETEKDGYYVLLNKYAVARGHFLLVTKLYESQSHPLTPGQLIQTYLLLLAAQSRQRPYFAFFNCGVLSGASQPHKHIQFMPGEPPLERLARSAKIENEARPFVIPKVPFAAHIKRLDRNVVASASSIVTSTYPSSSSSSSEETLDRLGAELSMSFMSVLDEMYQTMRVRAQHNAATGATTTSSDAPSTPSYNVVMTLEHIYLFPRSAEKVVIARDPSGTDEISHLSATKEGDEPFLSLSINSLGFGGMLLVKSSQELERVKTVGIGRMLSEVGMEPTKEEDNKGCDDVFADLT